MHRALVLLAIVACVGLPIAHAGRADAPAVLDPVVDQIAAELDLAHDTRLNSARNAHAYETFLSLSATMRASQWEASDWEDAQSALDPPAAFVDRVFSRAEEVERHAIQNVTRAKAFEGDGLPSNRVKWLLPAANFLVQAESHMALATSYLGGPLDKDGVREKSYRDALLLPIAKASHATRAADAFLDRAAAEPAGDAPSSARLQEFIAGSGAGGYDWVFPSGGVIHELARLARLHGQTAEGVTYLELHGLAARHDGLAAGGSPAALASALASSDASWWLQRFDNPLTPQDQVLADYLAGQLMAADLEAAGWEGEDEDGLLAWWMFAVPAAIAAGLFAAFRVRGRRKRAATLSALALFALLLANPLAMAESWPASQGPTVLAPDSMFGQVYADSRGIVHAVYSACSGASAAGCQDIYLRSLQEGAWTPQERVYDGSSNATLPKITWDGQRLHLTFLEGDGFAPGAPKVLKHCVLPNCVPTGLSKPNEYTVLSDIDAASGLVAAVWHEEHADRGRLYLAWWDNGWSAPRQISNEVYLARYPDLRLSGGLAHVAWQSSFEGALHTDRQVQYAAFTRQGASVPVETVARNRVDAHVRPSIDVQSDGTVGIAFNGWDDTFVTERGGDGKWSNPTNVSRVRHSTAWPILRAIDGDWIAGWATGSVANGKLWAARQTEGYWLAPQELVGSGTVIFPSLAYDGVGVHALWTGSHNAKMAAMHAQWGGQPPAAPPRLVITSPSSPWQPAQTLLAGQVFASAPIASVAWSIDGTPVPTSFDGAAAKATASLTAGPHTAILEAVDRQGRRSVSEIHFDVDTQPPKIEARIAGNGSHEGWHREPVALQVTASDDVAAVVQIDRAGRGDWQDLQSTSVAIPEGALHTVRLRARDPAGNAALTPTFRLGWDATPPQVDVTVPGLSRGIAVIDASWNRTGSPVNVTLTVGDASKTLASPGPWTVSLPEGNHFVVGEAVDAAGNRQTIRVGPVLVDRTPPEVSVANSTLVLADHGSGLARLVWNDVAQELSGAEASLGLDSLAQGTVRVSDRAGNWWNGTIDLASGRVVAETPLENQAVPAELKPADEAPGLPFMAGMLCLWGVLLLRRRR